MTQTKAKHLKDSMCSEFALIFELCLFVLVSLVFVLTVVTFDVHYSTTYIRMLLLMNCHWFSN